ncbi:MAG: hypothetical protein OEM52_15110, partial [bacterium]|nr:hypothetical protein [bacterium]
MATESIERGFIYQKIHFWLQAVKLFDETELVNRVVIESSDIKHLDDIVVYYHPSGIADGSQQILVDAIQVKHHDDHRTQYSIDNLIDKQLISKD